MPKDRADPAWGDQDSPGRGVIKCYNCGEPVRDHRLTDLPCSAPPDPRRREMLRERQLERKYEI